MKRVKNINKYKEWFNSLPEAEKDLPYFQEGEKFITPREKLDEIMSGKHRQRQLSMSISMSDGGFPIELELANNERALVAHRLDAMVKKAKILGRDIPSFGVFTGEEELIPLDKLVDGILNNSEAAESFVESQRRYIKKQLDKLEE